jgi:hypothetical protein
MDLVISPLIREGVLSKVVGKLFDVWRAGIVANIPRCILYCSGVLQSIRRWQWSVDFLIGRNMGPQRGSRSEQCSELLQISTRRSVNEQDARIRPSETSRTASSCYGKQDEKMYANRSLSREETSTAQVFAQSKDTPQT